MPAAEAGNEEAPRSEAAEPFLIPTEPAGGSSAQPKELATASQSKSVRVPLERLDRMMKAVGELVINRTRMFGRLGELERYFAYLDALG